MLHDRADLAHPAEHPPTWFEWGARPAGFYRVTQGLHVISGIASIPLLLAKLWSVFPRLFLPLPRRLTAAIERVALVPLVGGSLFLLFTGAANIARWYPWPFFFPRGHYWGAWITMGALVMHIGARAAGARAALGSQTRPPAGEAPSAAPRRPDIGSQGLPVNRTAAEAGVDRQDVDAWRLVVSVRDILEHAEVTRFDSIEVMSLEEGGLYNRSVLNRSQARDRDTLLATSINGEPLNLDDGYPIRLIGPNRPGVMQTKWVSRLVVR